MGVVDRIDHFQRRHKVVGFPLAVIYKFIDDFGGYLAALLTYYAFISIFPMLLLLSTVLGLVLADRPDWQEAILTSAVSEFPIVGDELRETGTLGGGPLGLVIGGLAALYGCLGVGQALQYGMNTAWMVPRNSRPNPFLSRGRGLLLLLTAGVVLVSTTVMTAFLRSRLSGTYVGEFIDLISIIVNSLVFAFVYIIATTRRLNLRDVLPGAVIAALLWQVLQSVGATYVGTVIARASNLNSVFALVLGMLVFLYTLSVIVLITVEINVVRKDRLYPRALLTPFTDNVDLTPADVKAYRRQAAAQRLKGYQKIEVRFERDKAAPKDPGA